MGLEEFLLDRAKKEGIELGIQIAIEKGRDIGIERAKAGFVRNLLVQSNFDDERIASLVDVDLDFVKRVKGGGGDRS